MKELINNNGLNLKEFLDNYNPNKYEKASNTVDMLLFTIEDEENKNIRKNKDKKMKILLIQRKDHPYINCWAIPGGFVNMNESLINAAYRELEEETNLNENIYLEQLYTFGDINRDPRMRVISTAYMALTSSNNIKKTKAGDDAKNALWFDVKLNNNNLILENEKENISIRYHVSSDNFENIEYKSLSQDTLAFDHIKEIYIAIERLRGKLFYTNIAFHLLPETFTLTELQKVYEIILEKEIDKSNFRKKIKDFVVKTNKKENSNAYRPATLYQKRL